MVYNKQGIGHIGLSLRYMLIFTTFLSLHLIELLDILIGLTVGEFAHRGT